MSIADSNDVADDPMRDAVATLRRRVTELEAVRDATTLLHRYGHCLDSGDEPGFVNCFAEDGRFVVRGRGPKHATLTVEGHQALREFARTHTRRPVLFHLHCVIVPIIELDGDRGRSSSYFFVLMEHERRPVVRVFGRYSDVLQRRQDGSWCFAERVAEIDSTLASMPPLSGGMP